MPPAMHFEHPYFATGATMDALSLAAVGAGALRDNDYTAASFVDCFEKGIATTLAVSYNPRKGNLARVLEDRIANSDVGFLLWFQRYCATWVDSPSVPKDLWKPHAIASSWLQKATANKGALSIFSVQGEFLRTLLCLPATNKSLDGEFWTEALVAFPGLRKWLHYNNSGRRNPALFDSIAHRNSWFHDPASKDELAQIQELLRDEDQDLLDGTVEKRILAACQEGPMFSAMQGEHAASEIRGSAMQDLADLWENGVVTAMYLIQKYMAVNGMVAKNEWGGLLKRALEARAVFAVDALCRLGKEIRGIKYRALAAATMLSMKDDLLTPEYDSVVLTLAMHKIMPKQLAYHTPFLHKEAVPINELQSMFALPDFENPKWSAQQLAARYDDPLLECPLSIATNLAQKHESDPPVFRFTHGKDAAVVSMKKTGHVFRVVQVGNETSPQKDPPIEDVESQTQTLELVYAMHHKAAAPTPAARRAGDEGVLEDTVEIFQDSLSKEYKGRIDSDALVPQEVPSLDPQSVARAFWVTLHLEHNKKQVFD